MHSHATSTQPSTAPRRDGVRALRRWAGSRAALAIGGGVLCAVLVLGAAAADLLPGRVALVASAVLALAIPTSRELARRALVAGVVFLGWIPMLWWWPLSVSHAAVVLALVVGVLAFWLIGGPLRERAPALVPRVRWSDASLLVSTALVVWVYLPGLRATSPESVLSRLLRGWDNSAHFDMSAMITRHGALINRVPDGPAGTWSYADYPQGFHAAAATVMEAITGGASEPAALLATYGRALNVVVVLAIVTVLAGVCSVPAVRRRPLLALPVLMFVASTFALGPGGMLLHNGFPNFVVAVACLACIPLIAVQMPRPTQPVLLAALGAAAGGVAHNWSLLLSMGAVGVVVALAPWRRTRWPQRGRDWVAPGVVVVVTVLVLAAAWAQLRNQAPLSDIVVIGGAVTPVPVPALVTTVAAAAAVCAALARHSVRGAVPHRDMMTRIAWTGLIPAVGAVFGLAIAVLQVRGTGDVGYYFWKYAIAVQMVAAVVLVVAVAALVRPYAPHLPRTTPRLALATAASVVMALAAVQAYGLPSTLPTSLGAGLAPGGAARTDYAALAGAPGEDARLVLAAVAADDRSSDAPHVLLPPTTSEATPPMMLSQWYNALTGRWSEAAQALLVDLPAPNGTDPMSTELNALHVLGESPDAVVVVAPQDVEAVRAAAARRGWEQRVRTW